VEEAGEGGLRSTVVTLPGLPAVLLSLLPNLGWSTSSSCSCSSYIEHSVV
jgi:hypothetical protein